MSLMHTAGCCCCKCSSVSTYNLSLPATVSCYVAGSFTSSAGAISFGYYMTLYKYGTCEYRTYIGDISDCDEYPYYFQDNISAFGMSSDMRKDIFCSGCDKVACSCNSLPFDPTPSVGTCTSQRVIATAVRLKRAVGADGYSGQACNCWQAQIRCYGLVWRICGDTCVYETRTDCASTVPTTGYTAHAATNVSIFVVKNTSDGIGYDASNNISPKAIYTGGNSATFCPSSAQINSLCGDRGVGIGTNNIMNMFGSLVANSPSELIGTYTMPSVTPACTFYSTSATVTSQNAVTPYGRASCSTSGTNTLQVDVTLSNLVIS